jgi:ABC-type transporter Mla subunit MlaD
MEKSETLLSKSLKTFGKAVGIGVVVGVTLLGQHYLNETDLAKHSRQTQHSIEQNRQDFTQAIGDLQLKLDNLQQKNSQLAGALDDCIRANNSLRHDMQELKRIVGVRQYSDKGQ